MGGSSSIMAPQYQPNQTQPGLAPVQPTQNFMQPMQNQAPQPSQGMGIQSQPIQQPTQLPSMPMPPVTNYPMMGASAQYNGQPVYGTGRGQFAHGGIPRVKAPKIRHKLHVGPIHSNVAGRTDHLPVHVPNGSYVIPADIISAMGEGNTMAGFKQMRRMFSGIPYGGGKMPYGASGGPYGEPLPGRAEGGEVDDGVPVVVAGGEYVLTPHEVRFAGDGDMERGHRVLDEFVKRMRQNTIKTLKKLPGPKRD